MDELPRRPVHDRRRRRRDAHRGPARRCAPAPAARTRRSSAAPATGRSPRPRRRSGSTAARSPRRASRSARSGLTTIHLTRAEELLRGQAPSEELFAQAGEIASADCSPMRRRPRAGRLQAPPRRRPHPPRTAPRHGARPAPGGLTMNVSMTVNGEHVSRDVEPRLLLVHFIRETLGLTGTHWGCDTSNCGACVVRIDGQPVKSCTTLAAMCDGHDDPHRRVARGRRRARPGPAGLPRAARAPVRVLHAGHADDDARAARREPRPDRARDPHRDLRGDLPLHRLQEHRRRGALGRRARGRTTRREA